MISSDLPIAKSSDDRLNRKTFAESLANVLLQSSFPASFTVGLYGAWGTGKTSLLNMIEEQIKHQDTDVVILRFNSWLCSDPKQLITQFFKQLANAIKLKKPTADAMCELVDQYADIFDATSLIPYVGDIIAAAGKAITAKARRHVHQKSNDLQSKKDEIINKLLKENMKIIVFIDDIDRLSEEEIISVFQLVKALADFPNAVYLLAFDYDVVVRALGAVQHGDGREYLEKIVQVPFEIPAPSMASIHNALLSKLDEILGDIPSNRWNRATWAELFQYGIKNYIRSMRDVIRYSNIFYLKYQLLKDETDPVDLIGLTCLQVFEPAIYSALSNYKDTLCGSISSYPQEMRHSDEEATQKAISAIVPAGIAANEDSAKRILGILFPKAKTVLGFSYSFGRNYEHKKFLINRNIAATECFDRYFSLSIEDDAIPSATIRHLVYDASENDFIAEVTQLYQNGKIIRLLEEVDAYADNGDAKDIPADRAKLLMQCLCRMWSSFEVEEKSFFAIPFAWRLLFCADHLLGRIDPVERFTFLQNIFNDKLIAPSTLALLLRDFETRHGRFTDNEPNEAKQMISLEELEELELAFRSRCIDAIDSGAALSQYNGLRFLWMLSQIDENLAKQIKGTLITDDKSLAHVISYCTSRSKTAGKLVIEARRVNKKDLSEFMDAEEAYSRMAVFVTTHEFLLLPTEIQKDVIALLVAMRRTKESIPTKGFVDEELAEEVTEGVLEKELKKIAEIRA